MEPRSAGYFLPTTDACGSHDRSGQGHLEWVAPYHRLRVGVFDVLLAFDSQLRKLAVLAIYRARSGQAD